MRKQFSNYKDVELTYGTWSSDITLTLVGQDTEQLDRVAQKVKKDLEQDGRLTDISTDVRLDSPRITVGKKRRNEGLGPSLVKRYDRQRSLTISANTAGISSGEGMTLVMGTFRKYAPTDGSIRIVPTGMSKHMKSNFKELFMALAIAIILVYMVMAVLFESFMYPFMVMFSLPLATTGVFGILLLAGIELDMMSMMGIILLVGIVVNNAIILVDFANQRIASGCDRRTAMQEAAPLRLRPILMTALSSSIAAVPIALGLSEGGEIRQPMSTAVIGGMLTSTFLTLFVIPAVYVILGDVKEKAAQVAMSVFKEKTSAVQIKEPGTNLSGGEK